MCEILRLLGYDEEPYGYLAVCLCYLLQSRSDIGFN